MSDQHQLTTRRRAPRKRPISPQPFVSSFSSGQMEKQPSKTSHSKKTDHSVVPSADLLSRNHVLPQVYGEFLSVTSRKRNRAESPIIRNVNTKKSKELSINNDESFQKTISTKVHPQNKEIERCPICLDDCTEPKKLNKCSHTFCKACIDYYFESVKPQCPCCSTIYGEIRGNQPLNGTMVFDTSAYRLPGFENSSHGTIQIIYRFPNGIQEESHPNPGQPYYGTSRYAYLPDNQEGRHVLALLQRAFQLRQIFTVGQSRTTGYDNVITWNDIHHKTSHNGGVENFGYPDATYLSRVKQELASKGII